MIYFWKGDLDNNKLAQNEYIIQKLRKRHKIMPIPWGCPVFTLANFTVFLDGTNIEKCNMQFVTAKFAPLYL